MVAFYSKRRLFCFPDYKEVVMATKELKKETVINNDLKKYKGKVLFPEKLAKANEILSKTPLPKIPKS